MVSCSFTGESIPKQKYNNLEWKLPILCPSNSYSSIKILLVLFLSAIFLQFAGSSLHDQLQVSNTANCCQYVVTIVKHWYAAISSCLNLGEFYLRKGFCSLEELASWATSQMLLIFTHGRILSNVICHGVDEPWLDHILPSNFWILNQFVHAVWLL